VVGKGATKEAAMDELCHGGWCHAVGPKIAVEVILHDWIEKISLGGAGR